MPAPANRQEFAALVNAARMRHHLSIRAVARIADVPAATAQGWLNGKHFPTPALRGN
ncbi:MAG: helix-turn-helix transcriptional regulator [Propionibacteriaceae bacterium]|nr:helix-turn-helix transcriptional regulator [Propionibacteriaceae bacterium]